MRLHEYNERETAKRSRIHVIDYNPKDFEKSKRVCKESSTVYCAVGFPSIVVLPIAVGDVSIGATCSKRVQTDFGVAWHKFLEQTDNRFLTPCTT